MLNATAVDNKQQLVLITVAFDLINIYCKSCNKVMK